MSAIPAPLPTLPPPVAAPATGLHALARTVGIVLAFARVSFLQMLQYRVRYAIGVANYILYVTIGVFLWRAMYGNDPTAKIGGFTLDDMIVYSAVGWISRSIYFSNVDTQIMNRVLDGSIAMDLLKPSGLLPITYGQTLGEALFRSLVMALPSCIILAVFFGYVKPPADALHGMAFALLFVSSINIFFCISFMVGLSAIFTERIQGMMWAKFLLIQFLSGLLAPLDWFPAWMHTILAILPFSGIAYVPLRVYLGMIPAADLPATLATQLGWNVVLGLGCHLAWNATKRHIELNAG
ncbi:MAG TPA: ABC-2 family transporter protein [Planctomycetota bacterium]|nr:ABC-2 family transporter protein [Planctomycetota bacterium]